MTRIRSTILSALLIVGLVAGGTGAASATFFAQTTDQTDDMPTEADVTFSDQSAQDGVVYVDAAALPDGGFVAIHAEEGNVLGVSSYHEPGTYEDVKVHLDEVPAQEVRVGAALHYDSNDNQNFDYEGQGSEVDSTYMEIQRPVADDAVLQPGTQVESSQNVTSAEDETGETEDANATEESTEDETGADDQQSDESEEPAENETGETEESAENETGETEEPAENETGESEESAENETGESEEPAENETGESESNESESIVAEGPMSDKANVVLDGAPNGLQTYSVTVDLSEEANASIEGVEAGVLPDAKLQILEQNEHTISFRAADLSDAVGAFEDARGLGTVNLSDPVESDHLSVTVDRLVADDDSEIETSAVSLKMVNNLFEEPLPGSAAENPPMDLDGDGLYEDINGDGSANFADAITLAFVEHDSLSEDQQAALDFNQNGELTFGDAIELAFKV